MELSGVFMLCLIIVACSCNLQDKKEGLPLRDEEHLANQIRMILKHYQRENAVGLPSKIIPDPSPIPNFTQRIIMNEVEFTKVNVYGLSKLRIINMYSELATMQANVTLAIDKLSVRGLYEQKCIWFCTEGRNNFTIDLDNITVYGLAKLEVNIDGKLYADNVDVDLQIERIDKHFESLDALGSILETTMDGTFIFSMIKPLLLKEVNTNIRGQVNEKLAQLPHQFPNSISPFDMAIAEARKQVRELQYDPLQLKDQSQDMGAFSIKSSHTWITGLSNFYRNGDIVLMMKNNTLFINVGIATKEIEGNTRWKIGIIGGYVFKTGGLSFKIKYLRVTVKMSQTLDTRKKASLEDIHFELGNIEMRVNGIPGTLDYLIDAAINILPSLLRYQIMEAIEEPLKRRLQSELDKINVEELIEKNIPEIEKKVKYFEGIGADVDKPIDDET